MKPLPKSIDQFEDQIRREVTSYWRAKEDELKEIIELKHEALREIEWKGGDSTRKCPQCGGKPDVGHRPSCELYRALRK